MKKTNILLITTDQQRFDTINALGNQHIYTPHLNWLCDEGIAYSRCYADSPVCMPSRASLMTGKHGHTIGLEGNNPNVQPLAEHPTLPGILTANGYQTRAQGKMHFSPMRANYGFEHMELPMDYYREMKRSSQKGLPKQHGIGENEIEPVISTVDEEHSLTYWTVKRSIDFLETRDETRPFFLWTSFTKPHPPFDPCLNYWNLYAGKDLPPPVHGDWSENLEDIPQGFMEPTYFLNNAYRMSSEQLKDSKRAYYACITQIDYSLGLLFARMREMGLFEDTWIIFTSDHGDMQGDHHMGAKSVFLEGSAHVPLLVRPPDSYRDGVLRGAECDTLVNLTDIMPTILNITETTAPDNIDGEDLLHFIDNPDYTRTLYGNCGHKLFAVIEREYKYMWAVQGGGELLFNIKNDPEEKHNLINDESCLDQLDIMRKQMLEFIKNRKPEYVVDGKLVTSAAPQGPHSTGKWPGFHSLDVPTDVLH